MRLAHPGLLALVLLVPALVWWGLRKKRGALRLSDLSFAAGARNRGTWLRLVPLTLYALAVAAMAVAMARPQQGRQFQDVETRGIDIMLCLDISGTMQAADFLPRNRLAVAKERAKEFIARREGDRIGLVIFAGASLTQCPLTTDRNILGRLLDRLDFGMLEDGTAIGMGIASATARLRDSKAKDRVIVLLTDGRNNAGDIDPLTAAQAAASLGIKIYTIGVGSKGPVPFPVDHPFLGRTYERVEVDLDTGTLEQIAAVTGGRFFLATDAEGLKQIYDEISRMEPTTFKARRHTVYYERAGLPLLLAVGLFSAGLVFGGVVLRRLP